VSAKIAIKTLHNSITKLTKRDAYKHIEMIVYIMNMQLRFGAKYKNKVLENAIFSPTNQLNELEEPLVKQLTKRYVTKKQTILFKLHSVIYGCKEAGMSNRNIAKYLNELFMTIELRRKTIPYYFNDKNIERFCKDYYIPTD